MTDEQIKEKKPHTLKDYYALPEERRAELIDGVFYDMAAPSLRHQSILLSLAIQFRERIKEHHQACEVYIAPCDVKLDKDDYTMVQPDLFGDPLSRYTFQRHASETVQVPTGRCQRILDRGSEVQKSDSALF